MSAFETISEFGHLARGFAGRQVERVQDWHWFATRRALPMVLLKDQQQLDAVQLELADEIIDWIEKIVEARPAYIEQHGLDPAIHFPQAGWALDDGHGLYDGFRAVVSRDTRVLNNLRLWSQQFTGYRLLTMEPAWFQPFPRVEEIDSADQRLAKMSSRPDRWVGRYLRIASKLPTDFRIRLPRQLGEIGWNCDGQTVSFDTYTYLERLAALHDCGLIEKLRTIASEGRTPCVVEIGGGFGGLSYYLSQLVPQMRIVIVDIPESLIYSSLYLSLLLPRREQIYARADSTDETLVPATPGCTFVPNYLFEKLTESHVEFDLAINTLSMSEMDEVQVEYYCHGLNQLLSAAGVFFEQNHDNTHIGRLNAKKIIARHFGRQQEVHSRAARALTQGRTHLWSRDPRVTRAEVTVSPSQISSIRRTAKLASSSVGNS
jgi:putative sugar O-methyltransferase